MEATMSTITILDYRPELKEHFKNLNMEWLKQFKNKAVRQVQVENPQEHIIEKGGFIFFAEMDNNIVGTSALLRESHKLYEIADMAVTPQYQGKHIGKILLQKTIDKAKQLGAKQVYLVSSTLLKTSLELYRALGFREMPYDPEMSIYDGSDVKMVLNLK
jgi:N-acetylglutamate synthase-like GNAT family acetyltransferase